MILIKLILLIIAIPLAIVAVPLVVVLLAIGFEFLFGATVLFFSLSVGLLVAAMNLVAGFVGLGMALCAIGIEVGVKSLGRLFHLLVSVSNLAVMLYNDYAARQARYRSMKISRDTYLKEIQLDISELSRDRLISIGKSHGIDYAFLEKTIEAAKCLRG